MGNSRLVWGGNGMDKFSDNSGIEKWVGSYEGIEEIPLA